MEEKRTCDGHCERCNLNQRTYCAAQMAYYNQQEIASIKTLLMNDSIQNVQTVIGGINASKNDLPKDE